MPSPATKPDAQGLNALIAPEVHQDELFKAIRHLAASARIDTVLEIGSSSSEGSRLAWVEGLRQNPRRCYHALCKASFIPHEEIPLVNGWLDDMATICG